MRFLISENLAKMSQLTQTSVIEHNQAPTRFPQWHGSVRLPVGVGLRAELHEAINLVCTSFIRCILPVVLRSS